jgi:hypothetical protein
VTFSSLVSAARIGIAEAMSLSGEVVDFRSKQGNEVRFAEPQILYKVSKFVTEKNRAFLVPKVTPPLVGHPP